MQLRRLWLCSLSSTYVFIYKYLLITCSLLFDLINLCLQDEVVKYSPHARAIRDVEDEELRSFFYGMSPWQVCSFHSISLSFPSYQHYF
jgi:hypothetical protein